MKNTTILICLVFPLWAFAQNDPANLDFEQKSVYTNISPWNKTSFGKKQYQVVRDSVVKYSGRYSLRFSYDTLSKNNSDGQVVNQFPIDVIGKKLKVSCHVKQSNPNDSAGTISFIISADKAERKLASKGARVRNAEEWKEYSFEFALDSFNYILHHLRITAWTKTKDSFWIDNFKIEMDGKDIYKVSSSDSPKGEIVQELSDEKIYNLQLLCYIWGFLKYYHPNVADGKFNWDLELFKKISPIKNAATNKELNTILVQWIDSLGAIPVCNNCAKEISPNSFSLNIDLKWMDDDRISKELNQKLKFILSNRHMGDGYYVRYEPVKNLFFDHENEYNWRGKEYPNELFRLQFLFRYWNTIQYFFPYKNIIGRDWNDILKEFVPMISLAKDSIEYHIGINKLVNSVNDSHSGNYDMILAKEFGHRFLPVQTKIIDDKAVVSGLYNDSLAALNGLQIGDVITRINNRTIKQIIDERIPLVNGSNYPRKIYSLEGRNFITGGKDSVVSIEYIRGDKLHHSKVNRYIFSELKYSFKQGDNIKWKTLNGNIGYVNMGILERANVDSMMTGLKQTKAIIFDIRNYPRSTYFRICEYLKDSSSPFASITLPDLSYPGNFLWNYNLSICGPTSSTKDVFHYKGKVILLVNELTQSHAEYTAMAFQSVKGAITIGSQTSGADGNASSLSLTGNYFTYLTGLGVFYPDRSPTQRIGVKIDLIAKPTIKGITEGRDEILEKALEIANK